MSSLYFAAALALSLAGAMPSGAAEATPDSLATPGLAELARLQAIGDQIYECAPGTDGALGWRFREPLATLMQDGVTVGRHFAGPEWLLDDGSFVKGKVVSKTAGERANDIAWLKLDVVDHGGVGRLSGVTVIERLDTRGGVFAGVCTTKGALHLEPYRADYVFFGPRR